MRILDYIVNNMSKRDDQNVPLSVKLLTAGISACIADLVTFPLDTVKVRMQISGEGRSVVLHCPPQPGLMKTTRNIIRSEGVRSLYGGLSAGLQRQTCFAGVRLGLYESVRTLYAEVAEIEEGNSLDLGIRVMAGLTTGVLAVFFAQPTDVVKIRFQAGNIGKSTVRYHSTLDAYQCILRNEGIFGLWKGTYPNMFRNAIINVGEIVCYEEVKELIINSAILKDGVACHLSAGLAAGFCATMLANPVDVVKTRFMNSQPGEYKSSIDAAGKMLRNEGPLAFYKGFIPSVTRLVSWNVVLWVTYEQLKIQIRKYFENH